MDSNNITVCMKVDDYNIEMQVTGDIPIKELTDRMLTKLGKPEKYLSNNYFFQTTDQTIDPSSTNSLDSLGIKNGTIVSVVNKQDLIKKNDELKEAEKNIQKSQAGLRHRFKKKIDTTLTIKDTLEDMAVLGCIKNQAIKSEPDKYYTVDQAVKNEDYQIAALGLLGHNLRNLGINVAIEKEEASDDVDKQIAANNLLQFLVNGFIYKKKYRLTFNLPIDKMNLLNNDLEKREEFKEKLKGKLVKEYNLKNENLIVTYYPQAGTFSLLVVFKGAGIKELTKEELMESHKFKYDNTLKTLSSVDKSPIIDAVILNKAMLDSRGDNDDSGWGRDETRGGEEYIPPEGWVRYGVRVFQQYDNGNNDWLSYDNRPGEWCIAYHEITRKDNVDCNAKYENDDDIKHSGQKVGRGTFCTRYPIFLEEYTSEISVGDKIYLIAFMLRVKPDKIRCPSSKDEYWVLNGIPDEIRPYGLLVKELK